MIKIQSLAIGSAKRLQCSFLLHKDGPVIGISGSGRTVYLYRHKKELFATIKKQAKHVFVIECKVIVTGNRDYINLPNDWIDDNVTKNNLVQCEYTPQGIKIKKYRRIDFLKYDLA